ncbi:uncharacterized protein LOC106179447 isoform X1 [Lingula anatina]|uniref:Uncharacterized protein LOC106179447 isoform X1 n=2 Tax=Lingula anatina TaxID=7574 RepID=A0A1S3K7B7_LINAN|nr:uncharacterized protein LOC106179447 isoform X1 [Lingula anatina]XP_013418526.1 uncharacterized protein LOC106179447 isoform X1 [Lingula anatina]XP_013418527.1 uncharacterized protein LOC106179447 isoform X1 [Lingula anatina]|eukprot:XP_013418525.1 uncharacterized protein LOC106179447 isoform X1 [Lingula anatina]
MSYQIHGVPPPVYPGVDSTPTHNENTAQLTKAREAGEVDENEIVVMEAEEEEPGPATFAIEPGFRNTPDNPCRESTITVPHLVRKVASEELVPKGWKSLNRVLIVTYISYLFCPFIACAANAWVWKAIRAREKGVYARTQEYSRMAVIAVYVAIPLGVVIYVTIILLVVLQG